ncbi:MAG: hypothetical protein CW691_11905 [Candidatus Bathyarchaeum sp.]|nr:MAG: hypothetical protein CW691_11905 [Candidatus Bathyarchaeum sp.]
MREEANRQGISINALTNKILQNYDQHWRWAERFGAVFLTRQTIARIIGCCPEARIVQIAKISGSAGAKDALRTMGISPTYQNLVKFAKNNMGTFGNWFDYSQHTRGKKEIIHLRHELGKNWSLFIANQVSTMFESILSKTVKSEIFDNSATLELTI